MKISAYHKEKGDEVQLNMPLWKADYTYGSYIFENSIRFGESVSKDIFITLYCRKFKEIVK
ncbi:unnamed protein product [marine sediment metagenome]|uniref:Uncharacterized protein n=1 Tax=marine sediment metagenome TaxID=412755 RepID=X1DRD8_9ZZZZ